MPFHAWDRRGQPGGPSPKTPAQGLLHTLKTRQLPISWEGQLGCGGRWPLSSGGSRSQWEMQRPDGFKQIGVSREERAPHWAEACEQGLGGVGRGEESPCPASGSLPAPASCLPVSWLSFCRLSAWVLFPGPQVYWPPSPSVLHQQLTSAPPHTPRVNSPTP